VQQYGIDYPFEKVRDIFAQDDLTVVNLEGTLYNSDMGRANKTYAFRGDTSYVQMLLNASIEACSLGNNHSMDYGMAGLQSTVETLEANGIGWFGSENEFNHVFVFEKDGIKIRGVYERSDAKVRELEGLERTKGFIGAEFYTNVEIVENDIKYIVDVKDGQKTGFFLDQKLNRMSIRPLCKNARVLDCFTHTGSFGLNAMAGGAKSILSVDASDLAIDQAMENARLNGFDARKYEGDSVPLEDESGVAGYKCADIFDLLPSLERSGELYDVVILDPPAFTKSRASIKKAVTGYREINIRGMRLVRNGGYLATCSCSHFMDEDLFLKTIKEAARDAHKRLRQIEFRQQGPDHPILWANDTSYYLKFVTFQVVDEI
jgi:23S rRNA (cytosine1962-C5)-methyltransferase